MSIASFLFRVMAKRNDAKRDAGLTTPENVKRLNGLIYGPDPKWNCLDVYRPKEVEGKLPVIVSVHGGGWVYGDKELYQHYCMSLVKYGFAVVNFTYRLAPKFKFPAQLKDTNLVFAWVLEHAEEYGFDKENVFAVGDSAGAHLLGLYCCLCTNPEYAKQLPFRAPRGFAPRAVALNCGVYRFERSGKKMSSEGLMKDLLPHKGTEEELRFISVTEHAMEGFPPCIVMTAEGDFLAAQAKPFAEQLQGLGVKAEYRFYGDKEHPLGHVFHCNMRLPEADQCNREECEYFRSFLERTAS